VPLPPRLPRAARHDVTGWTGGWGGTTGPGLTVPSRAGLPKLSLLCCRQHECHPRIERRACDLDTERARLSGDMGLDFRDRLARFGSTTYRRLRPAQEHVLSEYGQRHRTTRDLAVELPTGLGKTLVALLVADACLDEGKSVAILSGTRQLAEQVEQQATLLPGLETRRFWGGHYPGAALADYHQAQAVGLMNYWVYFNSKPVVQPADVIIMDDAHCAEQPLTSLFTLRIPRGGLGSSLYEEVCELLLTHSDMYPALQAMHDGTTPPGTPPELIAFNHWSYIADRVTTLIEGSALLTGSTDARWGWDAVRPHLELCGVLVGSGAIEIRPYHPPTRTVAGYREAQQRIYMSATLGTMDDLQRRLGVDPVTRVEVPAEFTSHSATGTRLFLLNPGAERSIEEGPLSFALEQAAQTNRVVWLCASSIEADRIASALVAGRLPVYRLAPGDDTTFERWRASDGAHLVAAGRFDGLDFPGDTCRLVVLPSVPTASSEFEDFVVAYLGDAAFMRHRLGQRVTQALGRANRHDGDWALYLGLDPRFGRLLADPTVTASITPEVRPLVQVALSLHTDEAEWAPLRGAANAFWERREIPVGERQRRPGRAPSGISDVNSAADEVGASTALWVGNCGEAAARAAAAAAMLHRHGQVEHAAFWKYVEAHARWLEGTSVGQRQAVEALETAVGKAPNTAWFARLRRVVRQLQGRRADIDGRDDLLRMWDEWLRERGDRAIEEIRRAMAQLTGDHHDEWAEAMVTIARLCGATGERPRGSSQADVIWTWVTLRRTERRLWEIKTGKGSVRVPRRDVNQLLGQVEVAVQQYPRQRVSGCLLSRLSELEDDAVEAARERIAVLHRDTVISLARLLLERFRRYAQAWGETAAERGQARAEVERALPREGWLGRLLAPSGGRCRPPESIDDEFQS
jgi:DEAD/DEAH box helicase/Helicase C-terminal domain